MVDPIEAAIDAFWRSAKGYSPGDSVAKDMRAAVAAYLRAEAGRRGGSVLLQAMAADLTRDAWVEREGDEDKA